MLKIENIVTGQELWFDEHTDPVYALLYAQCVEDDNLASWFFSKVQDNLIDDVKKKIKVYNGKLTISSGDWFYRKTDGMYPGSVLE